MDRRNFIGALLTIGAGFSILPGAGRLWVPERTIVIPDVEVASIWKTHRITYYGELPQSIVTFKHKTPAQWPHRLPREMGKIYKQGDAMWINSEYGCLRLVKMKRPLDWTPHTDSLSFCHEVQNHRWNDNAYEHLMPVQPAPVDGEPNAQV